MIYAACGEKDLALKQSDRSAKLPVGITYGDLKCNPSGTHARRSAIEKIVTSLAPERCHFDQVKSDNFFAELKRRNVYKVAVAYAVVGWLLVQVATRFSHFSRFRIGPCDWSCSRS